MTRSRRPEQPNILFILADDHGYGDVSAHHGPHVQTPHIDRIGDEGIRFTHMYANSPVCSPSRASLMTGRYPDLVGVPGIIRTDPGDNWGYFDPAATTLPDVLRKAGYHTCLVGKWHLGLEHENHPCRRGFHTFRGFLGDMMDDYFTHRREGHNYMRHDFDEVDPAGHATDIFTQWAVDYLAGRAGDDTPFFCCLCYNAPHTPIQPLEEWVDRVRARETGVSELRARYLGLVEHMDDGIGQVLAALERTEAADNTLVIYASDNGGWVGAGASNAPLRGGKMDMYEGGIRVPCCARWPGHIEAGRVSDQVCMLMDWFPSCCEAAGAAINHKIEGRSLLPLLHGGNIDFSDRWYYWVRREGWAGLDWADFNRRYVGHDYHAARHGRFKLMHNHAFAPLELFDLDGDPQEQSGLDTANHPAMAELSKYMQQQIQSAGSIPWQKKQA